MNKNLLAPFIGGVLGLILFFSSIARGQTLGGSKTFELKGSSIIGSSSHIHIETVVDSLEPGIYGLGILIDIDSGYRLYSMYSPIKRVHSPTVLEYDKNSGDSLVIHFERGEYGVKNYYPDDEDSVAPFFLGHVYIWDKIVVRKRKVPIKIKANFTTLLAFDIQERKNYRVYKELEFEIK